MGDGGLSRELFRQMKPVDGVEEEEGTDAFVEVVGVAAEGVEFRAFGEKLGGAQIAAVRIERSVALGGFAGGDELGEHGRAT